MANFTSNKASEGGSFASSTTQTVPLGSKRETKDGREFRYCLVASGSALVAGNCIQSSAIVANHLANTPPVVSIGDKSFTYTPGSTAGAANLYAEGFLQVDTTPGNGHTYQVSGHAAITSATAFTLNLVDAIQVALSTSSRVGLIANPYKNVIQMPVTTATGSYVGIAPVAIPASEFGWLQTGGIASVLIAGTPALGAMVMCPGATAGAAEVVVAAGTLIVAQVVGHMAQVGVAGKNNYVRLERV